MKKYAIKKGDLYEFIYMVVFTMYLGISILRTTMFGVYFPVKLYPIIRIITITIIIFKLIVFDSYNLKTIIKYTGLAVCILLIYVATGYNNLFDFIFLLLGAKNIKSKKIVKTYFIITTFLIIITVISSKIGIIENLQYYRPQSGKMRQSFGAIYPTDFGAHIFYLILSYCYIKRKEISYVNILVFISLSIFLLEYCDARLDAICIIVTSLLFILDKFKPKFIFKGIFKWVLTYSVLICSVISIGITLMYNYNPYSTKSIFLDKVLSERLQLGSLAIDTYGFSLFGKYVLTNGYGASTATVENYFFIDCSYLSIALRNGIVFLFVICILFALVCKKNIENENIRLPLIIALIAANSMVAHHFLDLAYNPFLILLATPVEQEVYQKIKHKIKIDFSFNKRRLTNCSQ